MFGSIKLSKEIKAWQRSMEQEKKPQTNADRIRAMSDEELAQLLKAQGCPSAEPISCYEHTCKDCWLEWLQQPAEVDNG